MSPNICLTFDAHDVTSPSTNRRLRLMRLSIFWYLLLIDISSDAFQQPIRSRHFSEDLPKIFRRCSPPIRSQENLRKIWSQVAHSTTTRRQQPLAWADTPRDDPTWSPEAVTSSILMTSARPKLTNQKPEKVPR